MAGIESGIWLSNHTPMAYNDSMFTFIELTSFSRLRDDYFDADGFAEFQRQLASNPAAGAVIPQTVGVRKIRWVRGERQARRIAGDLLRAGPVGAHLVDDGLCQECPGEHRCQDFT